MLNETNEAPQSETASPLAATGVDVTDEAKTIKTIPSAGELLQRARDMREEKASMIQWLLDQRKLEEAEHKEFMESSKRALKELGYAAPRQAKQTDAGGTNEPKTPKAPKATKAPKADKK